MKKTFSTGMALAAAALFAVASPAQAACTLDTQVAFHGLDSFFTSCPDAQPVVGYGYLISAPATNNTAGQQFACNDGSVFNGILVPCPPQAGVPGDGNIAVYYDWGAGNVGSVGCPNPAGGGDGTTPIIIQVTANDGSGVVASLGFNGSLGGFLVEQAHPLNSTGDGADPLPCTQASGPNITSVTAGPSPSVSNICVHVPPPAIHSDCDPGTVGEALALCASAGTTRPTGAAGRLFTRVAPCGSSPDPRIANWALTTVQPDAAGMACNPVNAPTTAGDCAFIGSTSIIGGTESAALTGWFQVPGPGAASDRFTAKADFARGTFNLSIATVNETSLVGFNVLSGTTKLNPELIRAVGTGNQNYTFSVSRGALKASKTVVVEGVKSTGTTEKITVQVK
jgi:hypothetical protein